MQTHVSLYVYMQPTCSKTNSGAQPSKGEGSCYNKTDKHLHTCDCVLAITIRLANASYGNRQKDAKIAMIWHVAVCRHKMHQ